MAEHTLHAFLRQFRPAADQRPPETVWRMTPGANSRSGLLPDPRASTDGSQITDSPIREADLQRWNDDGGHGRQQRRATTGYGPLRDPERQMKRLSSEGTSA